MLTVQEKQLVTDGFRAAGERMDGIESQFKGFQADVEAYRKMLKAVSQTAFGLQQDLSVPRKSFWPTEEMAEAFGCMVLQTLGKSVSGRQGRFVDDFGAGKALSETTNVGGGYLLNDEMRLIFIDILGRYGKFRKNCTVVPMRTAKMRIPKLTTDCVVYCPGEGEEKSASDMNFGQAVLSPKTWCALILLSNELEEDEVIGLGEIVARSMARSMAIMEDKVGFLGDGTAPYFGMTGIIGALRKIATDPAGIAGLKVGTGNTYAELTLDDFEAVVGLLPEEADDNAKWYMNRRFYYDVVWPLARAAGNANIFEILSDRKNRYLMGYEIEFISCMPHTEANSQICALLGDLQLGAYLAERKQLSIERSRDVAFTNYQTALLGVERVDVNAFGVGDATNPGPIVGLITAAS